MSITYALTDALSTASNIEMFLDEPSEQSSSENRKIKK